MQLSEMEGITVLSGQPTNRILARNREELPAIGNINILVPKAITCGRVNHNDITTEEYAKEINPEVLTQEGDIIVKLSSPYEACYITGEDEGLLVPAYCGIVRGAGSRAWYILSYLNSSKCQNIISNSCGGSVISMLKITSVRALDIPELGEDEEMRIGERFRKAVELRRLADRIWHLEEIRNNAEFNNIGDRQA